MAGTPSRTTYYGRSITDLVAFFFVFAAGSFALIAFPIHDYYSKVPTDHWVRAEHLSGALLFPAALILYIAQTILWRRRQRRLARQISDLVPESRATGLFPPEIQALVSSYDIECRLSGPPDTVDTDPTELLTAPQIVLPGVSRPILILPSRALARLRTKPEALNAVILHEIGHVVSRDSLRLDDTKRAISILIWLMALYAVIAVAASYHLDSQNGDQMRAFFADLEGKSLLIVATVQIALFAFLRTFLDPLREKIADNFVISQLGGGEGISAAEALLAGRAHERVIARGSIRKPKLGWFVLFGALSGISMTNLGGFISYLSEDMASGRYATLAHDSANVLYTYLPMTVCAWLLIKLFEEEQPFSVPMMILTSLFFGLGSWSIYFADHFVPVWLVSRIPEDYANVVRDDVRAVAFEGSTAILSDNLEKALVGSIVAFALCMLISARWRKPSLSVVVAVYIGADFVIRSHARSMLRFTEYDFYLWSAVALGIRALSFVKRYTLAAHAKVYAACGLMLVVYLSLRLEGFKEVSLRTDVATTVGTESFDAKDWTGAKRLFLEAHKSSWRAPVPMVWLGDIEDKLQNPKEAAHWYDAALLVHGWSSWNERIYALGHSADEHVDLATQQDLAIARSRVNLALQMRRENGRLGKSDVAFALGVYSYLLAAHGSDQELPLSLLMLAEACRMYPENHFYEGFAGDPGTARLDLMHGPRELPPDVNVVLGENLPSFSEDLWKEIENQWNPDERMAFARLIAYNASHE